MSVPHNLPVRLPLPAAEAEINRVIAALRDPDIPLVSIVGEGEAADVAGALVALASAHRLLDAAAFPGGICWLDCAGRDRDLEAMLRTVQETFGLAPAPTLRDAVRRHLREQPCLLIFAGYDAVASNLDVLAFVTGLPSTTKALLIGRLPAGVRGVVVRVGEGPEPLRAALAEFVLARTWDASQRIVEDHPELLSDEADALLGQMIEQVGAQHAVPLQQHRDLLRRCREVGIPRAFAEKMLPPEALAAAEAAGLTPEQALAMARAARGGPPVPAPERVLVMARAARGGTPVPAPEQVLAMARAARGGTPVPAPFQKDLQQAQEAEARYLRSGDRAALDEAAAAWERILGHPDFPMADERFQLAALNDAGGIFLRRYWARGHLSDLNRALAWWQTAMERTPPDHPDLPGFLNNLGNGLRARYARTGHLADLEEAIGTYRQAVERTPPDHPDLPAILNNLGTGLCARYARTGQLADLEEAIRVYQQAVERTPPDHPDRPRHLLALGTSLVEWSLATEDVEALHEALTCYRQALVQVLTSAPYLLQHVANRVLEAERQLLQAGRVEEAGRLAADLAAMMPPSGVAIGEAQTATTPVLADALLLRETPTPYRVAADRTATEEASVDLLRNVLAIVSAVVAARQASAWDTAYANALQALENARYWDRRTGEAFELVRWVRELSGVELVELEDADAWPPRVAYLLHLAARYERDENWDAAIAAYRQALELLDASRSHAEGARVAEVGFRLAVCLKRAGAWSEALERQEQNVVAYKALGDLRGKANAYVEMGHIYQMMNLFDPALLYYSEAYYLYRQVAQETTVATTGREARLGMATAREALGDLEFQLRMVPQAIADLEEAHRLYQELDLPGKAAVVGQTLEDARRRQGVEHGHVTEATRTTAAGSMGIAQEPSLFRGATQG
jgi:tetratricopeptide (TPR) repeat protein